MSLIHDTVSYSSLDWVSSTIRSHNRPQIESYEHESFTHSEIHESHPQHGLTFTLRLCLMNTWTLGFMIFIKNTISYSPWDWVLSTPESYWPWDRRSLIHDTVSHLILDWVCLTHPEILRVSSMTQFHTHPEIKLYQHLSLTLNLRFYESHSWHSFTLTLRLRWFKKAGFMVPQNVCLESTLGGVNSCWVWPCSQKLLPILFNASYSTFLMLIPNNLNVKQE